MAQRTCSGCKQLKEIHNKTGRCKPCYNRYMADWMAELLASRRTAAIAHLGGSCTVCGTDKNLMLYRPGKGAMFKKIIAWSSRHETFIASLEGIKLRCRTCHRAAKGKYTNTLADRVAKYELLRQERQDKGL